MSMEERCQSQLSQDKHEPFLRQCVEELLQEALFKGIAKDQKVLQWTNPEELTKIFDMSLHREPQSDEQLLEAIRSTIKYSVKTGHPYFVNQLFSTVDPYGLIGQWTTDALNPSVYTYEVSPVFTLMEETVLREMRRIVGFSADGVEGDGIFVPGGSVANGYAISCARFKSMPDVKVTTIAIRVLSLSTGSVAGCRNCAHSDRWCYWCWLSLEVVVVVVRANSILITTHQQSLLL